MRQGFVDLDRILRGEATRLSALRAGRIEVAIRWLTGALVVLGLWTGVCVGAYSVFRTGGPYFQQLFASTVKTPILFFLTLVVTFPSLYVFNALVGSKLTITSLLRLLVASIGVTAAVLAAFGPIVAFFSVSTTSYPFMVLLNVAVFAVAGLLGLKFLLQTLHRLSLVEQEPPRAPAPHPAADAEGAAPPPAGTIQSIFKPAATGALDALDSHPLGKHVTTVFRCWIILFGLVGSQMGWVLRPFIGDPTQPFTWFRTRESNFFEAVWSALVNLFS